jgi:hypothetical protein
MTSAMYASSQFKMYNGTGNEVFLERGVEELEWLIDNRSKGYIDYCWGLPFGWVMGGEVFAPPGTPFPTVTYYATDALMRAYEITRFKKFLNAAMSTVEFLLRDMGIRSVDNGDSIYFSYSPIDRFNVVNVNAYCAAMIARVNSELNFVRYSDTVTRLLRYVMSEQREDGSWNYWGRFEKERPESIDSLHQCYILKMLFECYQHGFKSTELYLSISRGLAYFNSNFYHDGKIWKFNPRYGNILELIDHAEALSMYAVLNGEYATEEQQTKTWEYISDNFYCNNLIHHCGNFLCSPFQYYSVLRDDVDSTGRSGPNIPFFRWGGIQLLGAMVDLWSLNPAQMQE